MKKICIVTCDCHKSLQIGEIPYSISYEKFQSVFQHKNLILWVDKGLNFLVPRETIQEIALAINQREKFEDALNCLPPLTIQAHQCIPIPSETAKILIEL